jgi:hypothetical protein
VKQYIAFVHRQTDGVRPVANMGIITCDAQTNYEAVNLLARHNLMFKAVRPQDLNAERLNRWNALVVFCAPRIRRSASSTILRNAAESSSGQSTRRLSLAFEHAGPSGQALVDVFRRIREIVELREPVTDPEVFARDLRRLIRAERSALSLWNSLTALVTGYRQESTGEAILSVINYADVPDNVQVQIKGRFASVQLRNAGSCLLRLSSVLERGGFTEFTIPRLVVAARCTWNLLTSARQHVNVLRGSGTCNGKGTIMRSFCRFYLLAR